MAFVDLVCQLKAAGKSLHDCIQSFTETFGAFDSTQISLRFKVLDDIAALMNAFRQTPPQAIGTQKITAYKDYLNHQEPHNILVYHLNNGNRVIIRPSGTEPKVKVYLDVVGKDAQDAKRALNVLENDMRELLRQEIYGKQTV